MRILHAANLQFSKFGAAFWNQDQKIHHGLMTLGHYVYTFSTNDMARQLGWFGSRDLGIKKMNKAFITCCKNVAPELIVIGHAQLLHRETLEQVRQLLPRVKIAYWYVDALWPAAKTEHLQERAHLFDAIFCTTAGAPLENICRGKCRSAFIPNVVHKDVENIRSYEQQTHLYDLIFIGSDKKDPQRSQQLEQVREIFMGTGINFSVFGALGQPGVFGQEKDSILRQSKAALNLSRYTAMPLYSSSRVAEMMGNGLMTCSPRGAELEVLYDESEMLYYSSWAELRDQVCAKIRDDSWRQLARQGCECNHQKYSATAVAQFIVDFTFGNESWASAPWCQFHYPK